MLIVTINPRETGLKSRTYATQATVLEALNDLARCAERRENILFAKRALNGFESSDLRKKATITVIVHDSNQFGNEDTVRIDYDGRTEYYKMSQIIRLFSGLA